MDVKQNNLLIEAFILLINNLLEEKYVAEAYRNNLSVANGSV